MPGGHLLLVAVAVVVGAGLELVTELRFPARGMQPPQVLLCAQRPER